MKSLNVLAVIDQVKEGNEVAIEELKHRNHFFVEKVAKQYEGMGLEMPQLMEAGKEGLIRAAKHFDTQKSRAFIAYSIWWVRQSILQALSKAGRPDGEEDPQLTEREKFIIQHTDEEAAAQLNITPERVRQIRKRAQLKQNPTT